jgi:hypothetical protein
VRHLEGGLLRGVRQAEKGGRPHRVHAQLERHEVDLRGYTIKILGATPEEACLKKRIFFKLISTLLRKVKRGFADP